MRRTRQPCSSCDASTLVVVAAVPLCPSCRAKLAPATPNPAGGFKEWLQAESRREAWRKVLREVKGIRTEQAKVRRKRDTDLKVIRSNRDRRWKKSRQYFATVIASVQARTRGALRKLDARRKSLWADYREVRGLETEIEKRERARRKARRPSIARVTESDDRVRGNIEPELVPVWERVKTRIKGTRHRSRTEAFAHWVQEHPDDVAAILQRHERISGVQYARQFDQWHEAQREAVPF